MLRKYDLNYFWLENSVLFFLEWCLICINDLSLKLSRLNYRNLFFEVLICKYILKDVVCLVLSLSYLFELNVILRKMVYCFLIENNLSYIFLVWRIICEIVYSFFSYFFFLIIKYWENFYLIRCIYSFFV